jgi:hypothetical protein
MFLLCSSFCLLLAPVSYRSCCRVSPDLQSQTPVTLNSSQFLASGAIGSRRRGKRRKDLARLTGPKSTTRPIALESLAGVPAALASYSSPVSVSLQQRILDINQ